MSALSISRASAAASDHLGIGSIHVRGWRAGYGELLPASYLEGLSVAERQATWRKRLEEPRPGDCACVLVARRSGATASGADAGDATAETTAAAAPPEEDEVVGWIGVDRSRDADARDDGTAGEVWGVYVDPDRWAQGVGSALLREGLQRLVDAGFATCSLWVLAENHRARSYYERNGFVVGRDDSDSKLVDIGGVKVKEVRYYRKL